MRAIDADTLINRIVFHTDMPSEYKEQVEDTISDMPTIEPKQQWIPCSERLPEKSDLVIICSEFGGIEFGSYEEGKWYWLAESCSYYLEESIDEVVAWMEMPSPWKGDK